MAILESGTVVAVATPEGEGGLAVVRLSGPEALAVARRLLSAGALADPVDSHRARLALVRWPARADTGGPEPGTPLDQALVLPMLAPASYTGEDTVEFFCHGGLMPARQIAAACRAAGARGALPGEFTRRAFLNGRLSLVQAEAVAELIAAEHAAGARAALAQLTGGLNRQLAAVEGPLRDLLARIEGALEFSEEDAVGPSREDVATTLRAARRQIDDLLDLAPAGRLLRDGVQVVLVGAPNVGKSSLFNALLGADRALVDPEAGTTRDVVTAPLELDGVLFVLHDTAGLRDRAVGVEAKGVARTRETVAGADLVLALRPVTDRAQPAPALGDAPAGCPVLPVWTKGDLDPAATGMVTSSRTGQGIEALRRALLDHARAGGVAAAVARGVILNQRHQDRLLACRETIDQLLEDPGAGDEVAATLLAATLQELGAITGRVFTEQLLGEIFSRFCVGK
ncbi:MAG TPA: tRNA uridine-5-carboxymethylaminomethyl(34) synthesis GTPase MnmE [Candidatus Krumholzibacteria bacterium]|nr:tRNA uridine-5-carboxymethylaminomethyl(34) synthesis GTPase MnmE [Candidatus Krumholzibacteria bacterium]HPD73017.1 tRNA uridine-5-carboxymethylaminomethyl(34) synthesis GTPase MnmE [Candidatus Krumholzibacteria bacterium]HRY41816.1 tRNA uridine-5-carboxymethylaminomethyl(34) synthesis GTPase MnmE [Candidatus Krumholzibacteria bacterium]